QGFAVQEGGQRRGEGGFIGGGHHIGRVFGGDDLGDVAHVGAGGGAAGGHGLDEADGELFGVGRDGVHVEQADVAGGVGEVSGHDEAVRNACPRRFRLDDRFLRPLPADDEPAVGK